MKAGAPGSPPSNERVSKETSTRSGEGGVPPSGEIKDEDNTTATTEQDAERDATRLVVSVAIAGALLRMIMNIAGFIGGTQR
jgi:hypothetical protein